MSWQPARAGLRAGCVRRQAAWPSRLQSPALPQHVVALHAQALQTSLHGEQVAPPPRPPQPPQERQAQHHTPGAGDVQFDLPSAGDLYLCEVRAGLLVVSLICTHLRSRFGVAPMPGCGGAAGGAGAGAPPLRVLGWGLGPWQKPGGVSSPAGCTALRTSPARARTPETHISSLLPNTKPSPGAPCPCRSPGTMRRRGCWAAVAAAGRRSQTTRSTAAGRG